MSSILSEAATLCADIGTQGTAAAVAVTTSSTVLRDELLQVVDLRNIIVGQLLRSGDISLAAVCDRPQLLVGACADGLKIWEMALPLPEPVTLKLPDAVAAVTSMAINPEHVVVAGSVLAFCRWRITEAWCVVSNHAAARVNSLSFDSTQPTALWLGTDYGPFALDLEHCLPPILVPMVLSEDAPWCSPTNDMIARKALQIPPDLAVTQIAPHKGAPVAAIAGGNGLAVAATDDAVYIACSASQRVSKLDVAGVRHVSVMVHVALVHDNTLMFFNRSGKKITSLALDGACTALVATEAGARLVVGGIALTVVLKGRRGDI